LRTSGETRGGEKLWIIVCLISSVLEPVVGVKIVPVREITIRKYVF